MRTVEKYFQEHPEARDEIMKAYYAFHAPHFRVEPSLPLHNFAGSARWSKCAWCERSREEVRYDALSGQCLMRPAEIKDIKEILREESESFWKLLKRAETEVPKLVEKLGGMSGDNLAILHHTHGYDPETVAGIVTVPEEILTAYHEAMERERILSRASQRKEIIEVKLS